jgi:hypothetical protein
MSKTGKLKKTDFRITDRVLKIHYEWCKKEGRDISWYEQEKQNSKRSKDSEIQA